MSLTVTVEVTPRDHEVLASWVRSPSIRAGLARRARIVLLAGDGLGTSEIMARTGVSKPTVIFWKRRYAAEGIGGLEDRPKPGKPRTIDDVAVVLATLEPPSARLGVTHWSSRLLAAELGLSNVKVAKVWREWGLQPWRAESFKFSTDPQLEAKVRYLIGLYLNPPDKAVVLCVDEKPQAQALERAAPVLPLRPGTPEKRSHDYIRHGTTTLFAALEVPPAGSPTPATPATGTRSSVSSSARSRGLTHAASCISWWTTTAPTPIQTCRHGLPSTPGSRCTSRPRRGPGSTWRSSFRSSPARRSAAAASPRSKTSSPPSRPSSRAGTTAATPSPGPKPQRSYSRTASPVREPHSHDTSDRSPIPRYLESAAPHSQSHADPAGSVRERGGARRGMSGLPFAGAGI